MSQAELLKEINRKISLLDRTLLISIDGPAGAGKTTLANNIANTFSDCHIIHMDDLYRGWVLTLGPNLTRELISILEQLEESGNVSYTKFDWLSNSLGEICVISNPQILILEGVGAGQKAISSKIDIKVWVEIPYDMGLKRVLARDGMGIKDEMARFLIQQDTHFKIEETRENSDFLILGN